MTTVNTQNTLGSSLDSSSLIDREWIRPNEVKRFYPTSRSYLYELIKQGKVRSKSIRKRGNTRGMRWVSLDSLREYFDGIPTDGQEGK